MSDINATIAFLKLWNKTGPWMLTGINPNGGTPIGKLFSSETEMRSWLGKNVEKFNLYFSVNDVAYGFKGVKASKSDIEYVRGLHVDIDPIDGHDLKDEQKRIKALLAAFPVKPTAVIFSGNGLQGFWKLKKRVELVDDAVFEEITTKIATLCGTKGTANIDRIMRLPGTNNLPSKAKIKKGRKRAEARLLYFKSERTYGLDDFSVLPSLPPIVETWLGPLLLTGERPDRDEPYNSRSEASFAAVAELKKSGMERDDAQAVMLDPSYAISEHLLDQKDSERSFERAWDDKRLEGTEPTAEADLDGIIEDMNTKFIHAFDGGQEQVMQFTPDGGLEGPYRFLKRSAFLAMHEGTDMIRIGKKSISIAEYWITHPLRRKIQSIVFEPGKETPDHYNLWQGWSVQPARRGDVSKWSLFQEHLWKNVCAEDWDQYDYYLSWWAHKIQNPASKVGTAIILQGGEGTGKTATAKVFQRIFGPHMLKVNDPGQVLGHFNGTHAALLVLHSEESFWAGDKRMEGKLKDIITSDTQQIEFKGKEPKTMPNYYDLYVTGNPDWLVPASLDARRFAVYKMAEHRKRDNKFFDALREQMWEGDAPGCAALMKYLLDYKVRANLGDVPITAGLVAQKELSMSTLFKFLRDMADTGEIFGASLNDPSTVLTFKLYDGYILECDKMKENFGRKDRSSFGRELYKLGIVRKQIATGARIYQFPLLPEFRRNFDKLLGKKRSWGNETEWKYLESYEGEG